MTNGHLNKGRYPRNEIQQKDLSQSLSFISTSHMIKLYRMISEKKKKKKHLLNQKDYL